MSVNTSGFNADSGCPARPSTVGCWQTTRYSINKSGVQNKRRWCNVAIRKFPCWERRRRARAKAKYYRELEELQEAFEYDNRLIGGNETIIECGGWATDVAGDTVKRTYDPDAQPGL
ncbi:hypothetical protein KIN20_024570 [Parelaphostrongylus tenuis]|uniref:Uncharacterized protein n=1 Tax=Parelaphostrongylus tenuis TaxID=148309 RepID=A0AAD5QTR1_PARTN|nr:hypothetical protein KIN20_024570 [Parelaphostrongylus tenuis]